MIKTETISNVNSKSTLYDVLKNIVFYTSNVLNVTTEKCRYFENIQNVWKQLKLNSPLFNVQITKETICILKTLHVFKERSE